MMTTRRAVCRISIAGSNVTAGFLSVLQSISVSDSSGTAAASASIEVDDTNGRILMPAPKAPLRVSLGWEGGSIAPVFEGYVDDIRARGSRSGRTLSISAKEFDATGKAKQHQSRHWDEKTVKDILTEAGKDAGVSSINVDPSLADIVIPYEAMNRESFIAFGTRLAKAVGGTFKVRGTRATMLPRNGIAGGSPILAAWGVNLHDYDLAPFLGRPRFKKTKARYYDRKAAKWIEVETETEIGDIEAEASERYDEPDEDTAKRRTKSAAKESERQAGGGNVTIEGEPAAEPEAPCVVSGTRPGIDGSYRIDSVEHSYSRSGFTTRLTLKKPGGGAGTDNR